VIGLILKNIHVKCLEMTGKVHPT